MDHSGMGGDDKMDMGNKDGDGMDGMDGDKTGDMDHSGMADKTAHGSIFYASRYASILFDGAYTTSIGGLILAVLIVVIVSVLYEMMRRYKAYFDDPLGKCRCSCNDQKSVVVEMRGAEREHSPSVDVNGDADKPVKLSVSHDHAVILPGISKNSNAAKKIQKMCLRHRTIYTAISVSLHMFSLTISYFLMLIAMTFNVWLFLAVIIGSGLGKLVTMTLMEDTKEDSSQSHCNMP